MKWYKVYLILVYSIGLFISTEAQPIEPPCLVITEIMYNPPESGADSLEFIEIQARCGTGANYDVSYWGATLSSAVDFEFPSNLVIQNMENVIIAKDSVAFETVFGIPAFQWSGTLLNGGESIVVSNNIYGTIDSVSFSSLSPWPNADGNGRSIVLCGSIYDNNDPSNWQTSQNNTGIIINGQEIYADPGQESNCLAVGVEEVNAFEIPQLYPNPTKNRVQIDLGLTIEITAINTYNSLGELVHTEKRNTEGLLDYALPNPEGVYLIQLVHTDGNVTSLKVVKE